jgi:hypothetical protein
MTRLEQEVGMAQPNRGSMGFQEARSKEPFPQKPVAWGVFEGNLHDMFFTEAEAVEMAQLKGAHAEVKPLYTKENT